MFYYEFNKNTNKHAIIFTKKDPVENLREDVISPPEFSTVAELISFINQCIKRRK